MIANEEIPLDWLTYGTATNSAEDRPGIPYHALVCQCDVKKWNWTVNFADRDDIVLCVYI